MARIYYETLSKEVKRKIRNKEYSHEQLKDMFFQICEIRNKRKATLKYVAIFTVCIAILAALLSLISPGRSENTNMYVIASSIIFMIIACTLCLGIAKFLTTDLVYYQFVYLVKKHYPEYKEIICSKK